MTLTTFVTWIAVAVVTGWAAGLVGKAGGHGTKADILLAVAGSGLASSIAAGIDLFPHADLAASAVIAFVGAVAAVAAQRRFFYAPRD
jgi:uncharacterized membrane protein YeaQ/YmgE (transglycosylase-associated protein family)